MNERKHYSDEILNALIDGELEAKEQARIYTAMEGDEILRRRFNDLRQVSELVKAAFEGETPIGRSRRSAPKTRLSSWPVAAMIGILGLGSLFGWHLYGHKSTAAPALAATSSLSDSLAQIQPASQALKVLFHVGREDPKLLDRVLTEAETLLSMQGAETRPLFVRIVASHGGLSLFQVDTAHSAQRISRLQREFDSNIAFVGCGETYGNWNSTPKQKSKLLPEMIMVDSGVSELLRRQKQGWSYIRI